MKHTAALLFCLVIAAPYLGAQDSSKNALPGRTLTQENILKAYTESYREEAVGRYAEALRSLAEVYEVYPKTYTVNYRMGWLYYCNRNYTNALASLDRALAVAPPSIEALNIENLIFAARSEWTTVEAVSLKIVKIDYYNTYANSWYAISLRMQGKYDYAVQVCRKMLAVFPTSTAFLQELATNLYLSGERIQSRAAFESALVLDPNNETAKAYLKKF